MTAYYNEHDEFAASWLRNLIAAGLIADGEVDTRSIVDVRPSDLRGYAQCHFFAGIGGWSYALRRAGWADSSPVWTGSCPCQPFSLAGAQRGFADERHLWPVWRELIRECGPAIVFGEQVASATDWLRLVRSDLEEMGRAVGAMPIQAASAGADHLRDRYWFVADPDDAGSQGRRILPECAGERIAGPDGVADAHQLGAGQERQQRSGKLCGTGRHPASCDGGTMANADSIRSDEIYPDGRRRADGSGPEQGARPGCARDGDMGDTTGLAEREPHHESYAISDGRRTRPISGGAGDPLEWVVGADGKARRVKPGIRLLAHGVPNRVGLLRGFGNAIDPRPAAAFIEAYLTSASSQNRGAQ